MKLSYLFTILIFLVFNHSACTHNPVTGRKQLILVPDGELNALSNQQYQSFISQSKVIRGTRDALLVERLGGKIANAVKTYLSKRGESDLIQGYNWEFRLVENNQVNAWCMPGGKVVVYTGILPVTQDENSLAVVMGHEIAHAIARHGNERMSQVLLQETGQIALSAIMVNKPAFTSDLFLTSYGIGTQIGVILPFSRRHELEADRFGLIFAAMAGYDPHAAYGFWQRMSKQNGGSAIPEWLSTHPSDQTRLVKIREYAKEAALYAQSSR